MISLTIFDSLYDNKTRQRLDIDSWSAFENMLKALSKLKRESKKDAQLISPAIYKPDTDKRRNANVEAWGGWAAIDVDDHQFEGDLEKELEKLYGQYQYVCYSTASSTEDHPKFRMVFQLNGIVHADHIRHFWHALNTELDSLGDKQCKDLSRMYYIPGDYRGAYNFFFTHPGKKIDHIELMERHQLPVKTTAKNFIERLPEQMQKEVVKYRQETMENAKKFSWTTYTDCPFVNKKLIREYRSIAHTDGSGRYSMIYKIMVSIASLAIKNKYPISEQEIVELIRQLDQDTANRYQKRPLDVEASRAIEYAYKKM